MARQRTPDEVRQAFEIQKQAIIDSCASFDAGKAWEGLRLATSAYVMLHDGGKRNRSILSQLGVRDTMKFLASAEPVDPNNLLTSTPLVATRMGPSDVIFVPVLDTWSGHERWISFGEWWDRDPVFSAGLGRRPVSRKNLIFNLRSKDGGAHYDADTGDAEYSEMADGGGWVMQINNQPAEKMVNLHLTSMRQVAFELLQSLERQGL